MLRVAWLCLDGTNSWSTNSSLGANLIIRQPMLQRFLDLGCTVEWFGLREDTNVIEGKEYPNMHLYPLVKKYVNERLRVRQKEWDSKKKRDGSMSKWVVGHAINDVLDWLDEEPLPKADFLFAEYMDNGPSQIAYFSVILIHYARRNIPIYVRDTERRFRYNSEIQKLFESKRDTIYSHRLGRYVDEEHIESLRGMIRMVYPFDAEWDDGTNGFYRDHPFYMPIVYDPTRELPLLRLSSKSYPVLYIGNDNNRREMLERWYSVLRHKAHIYGNWRRRDLEYVNSWKEINKKVRFGDAPIPMIEVLPTLQKGWTSVVVYPKHYVTLGQVTDRMAELGLAGTIPIAPVELWNATQWTLPEFIVGDAKQLNRTIQSIMDMKQRQYDEAVMAVRLLLRENFDADYVFNDFCVTLMKDGIRIWR